MTLLGSLILSQNKGKSFDHTVHKRLYDQHSRSLIFAMCFYIDESQCLIHFILLFSKPQPRSRAKVDRHYQPRPFTKRDRDHHLYASCCQAVRTLLCAENLYAIHRQFCHIALFKKYILWSRSFCEFVPASL